MQNAEEFKKLLDGPIEEERERIDLLREAEEKELLTLLCEAAGMNEDDAALLLRFTEAAANFYGRIPLGDFYRILRELAPELEIGEEQFCAFMRAVDDKKCLYVLDPTDISEVPENVTMDCDLATQWVAWNGEAYDEICERHASCPRYVPNREEFLRYEDDLYAEENSAKHKMREFLKNACGLQGEDLEDCLEELMCSLRIDTDLAPDAVLQGVMSCVQFQKDLSRRLYMHSDEFVRCIGELHEHTRRPYTNGYTLAELRKMQAVTGIEVEPEVDFSEYELAPERKTKIGRNDPCPCGSGKKYKKCCGRGK